MLSAAAEEWREQFARAVIVPRCVCCSKKPGFVGCPRAAQRCQFVVRNAGRLEASVGVTPGMQQGAPGKLKQRILVRICLCYVLSILHQASLCLTAD